MGVLSSASLLDDNSFDFSVPTLFTPNDDCADPIISILIPALNEEKTIAQFVEWCKDGLAAIGVPGEIVIVDSSSDRTAEIALSHGARVVRTQKRGLGRAYIDGIPFTRGKYLILGDADCTYDFRSLTEFYEKFEAGYEFVMGSRFKGFIEDGAMPALHRYFGTPFTTWILNFMYGTDFSDIHCGMRGITKDAFIRMQMHSQSWEYASEMVLKSVHMGLKRAEVPVRFLKDMEGRTSHHVREGWFSPWKAGWINLKAMCIFGADFFLWWPGIFSFFLGLCGLLFLSDGPRNVLGVTLSLNAMLFCLVLFSVGLQMALAAVIATVITDGIGVLREKWRRRLAYTPVTLVSMFLLLTGLLFTVGFVYSFIGSGFTSSVPGAANHHAIFGLALIISAALLFSSMLILHSVIVYVPAPNLKVNKNT